MFEELYLLVLLICKKKKVFILCILKMLETGALKLLRSRQENLLFNLVFRSVSLYTLSVEWSFYF